MKNYKHLTYSLFVVVLAAFMVSCMNETTDSLTSSQITKKYNKQKKADAQNVFYADLEVGRYLITDEDQRCNLLKLQAAGIVTYQEERFVWWEEITRGRKVSYKNPDYWVATVALTPKGEKLRVDARPAADDIEFKRPKVDYSKYPDGSITAEWEFEKVPNPFIVKKQGPATVNRNEPVIRRIDSLRYEAYGEIEDLLYKDTVILEAYSLKAKEARKIEIQKHDNGSYSATAEVVYKAYDVTEVGRILCGIYDGALGTDNATLHFYQDKGWSFRAPLEEEKEEVPATPAPKGRGRRR